MIYMMVTITNTKKRKQKMSDENKVEKPIDSKENYLYNLYVVILNSLFK